MKRMLVALTGLFALVAATAATAAAPTVTMDPSRRVAIFGDAIDLNGAVDPATASQPVSVKITPQDGKTVTRTVMTQTDGSFTLTYQPRWLTTAVATYQNASSREVILFVRPRVSLRRVSRTRFAVTVVAGSSLAGKYVWISRYVPRTKRYFHVTRVFLQQSSRSKTVSVGTSQKIKIRRLTKLRAFLPRNQARPNYLDAQSNFIVAR
jgi:hypothetical protein